MTYTQNFYIPPIRPDELYHHGILGMKWGIRRYQPYPKGYKGDGKEVGKAKKSKTPISAEERAAKSARRKETLKKVGRVASTVALSSGMAVGSYLLTSGALRLIGDIGSNYIRTSNIVNSKSPVFTLDKNTGETILLNPETSGYTKKVSTNYQSAMDTGSHWLLKNRVTSTPITHGSVSNEYKNEFAYNSGRYVPSKQTQAAKVSSASKEYWEELRANSRRR